MQTLAFFNQPQCPKGWAPATNVKNNPLNGYFLVPFRLPQSSPLAGTTLPNVPPLTPGSENQHQHSFSTSIALGEIDYAGSPLGGDYNTSNDGAMSFSSSTGSASMNVPYVALLICVKQNFTPTPNPPVGVPEYIAPFFEIATCPDFWKPTPAIGRFIVGVPAQNGTPEAVYGGNPLSLNATNLDGSTGPENRTHTHPFSGQVTVPSTTVELDSCSSGCGATGYGRAGNYTFKGTTLPAAANLPYVIISQCQPCTANDPDSACSSQQGAPRGESKP